LEDAVIDLAELVDQLRATGGDTAEVEVKSAAGGLPESITPTLSALANLPGGGVIILGLDERHGFAAVGLPDPQTLKQGLGSRARAFEPPVRLTISDGVVDGQAVVIAEVHECDAAAKPCRVASTGRAYLRSYDGDYELSAVEQAGVPCCSLRAPRRSGSGRGKFNG
jgi:ATP-dependent DNA helicase RecG